MFSLKIFGDFLIFDLPFKNVYKYIQKKIRIFTFPLILTLSCIMLENSKTYFKNLAFFGSFFDILHERVKTSTNQYLANNFSLIQMDNSSADLIFQELQILCPPH